MKTLLCSLLLLAAVCVTAAHADIQDPPVANQGPTRKLGRGFSNLLFGVSELQVSISLANEEQGNMAIPYGFVRGVGRSLTRMGVGFYEMVTAPFPLNKGKYTPTLRSDIPWIHGGYEEFPPELGWESRYNYAR